MAVQPVRRAAVQRVATLRPFQFTDAATIASWAKDAQDAEWLAPRTAPPLTAAKVRAWHDPSRQPFCMVTPEEGLVAYGELNVLQRRRSEYWLGHLVVNPALRGRGYGRQLVRLLLERAFGWNGARRVTLVVFPENKAAIAAYRAAGMRSDGYETHYFAPYRKEVQLLRMECRGL